MADRGPSQTGIPLAQLPPDVAATVEDAGVKQVNLYRSLSHAPDLLRAWIDFAWALRGHDTTSRRLRELCILRTASLHHSQYEWHQHRRMGREVGVTDYQVAELEMWRTSDAFDDEERAALALTDAIIAGHVPDEVIAELERHFDNAQRVELTVTAAFYAMVPRILDALRVPVEGKEPDRDLPRPSSDGNAAGTSAGRAAGGAAGTSAGSSPGGAAGTSAAGAAGTSARDAANGRGAAA